MGFFASLFRAGPAAHDDFWYRPAGGGTSLTGVRVDANTALKLSAVWACVRIISESVASLPLPIYRVRPDGGKERAPYHALYEALQYQPNDWQTAQAWRQQMTVHALLRGAGFSRLVAGPRGPSTRMEPLNPDWLTIPATLDKPYIYRAPGQPVESIHHDRMFRVDGLSLDGVQPCSVIEYARESMGIGMAAEQYAGRVFSQDGRPRGTLEHPGKLSKDAADRLKETWQEAYAGLSNAHRVAVLQEGMKFNAISVTPDDAQMLATREFSVEDVCRWFGVPPHMVGSTAKVTSWGSGIEQLSIGFVTYTLLPWLKRWEQSIRRDLIFKREEFFAEHVIDGLLRGDQESRYRAYMTGRTGKWLSANDVRRSENMNPIPGGDVYENPAITVAPQQTGAALDGPDWHARLADLAGERTNGHADH
jgi:HK97 family phage portal protein